MNEKPFSRLPALRRTCQVYFKRFVVIIIMIVRVAIFLLNLLTVVAVVIGHNINSWRPLIRPHDSPLNIMTDIINDIGVKLLDCYIDRPGNVAFSPTGLAFVLTALYEGSAGHTNRQLVHVLGLPRDRRITRIGMRDIHRKLRSYLNADAFLGGLTLNRDDIMLRPEYEDILRFYGFDIADSTNVNDTANNNSTTTATALTENVTIAENTETTTEASTTLLAEIVDSTTSIPDPVTVTTNPTAEIISTVNDTNSAAMNANLVNVTDTNQTGILITTTASSITVPMGNDSISATSAVTSGVGIPINDGNVTNSTMDSTTTTPNVTLIVPENINNTTSVTTNGNVTSNVRKKRSFDHRTLLPVWFDDLNDWQDYPAPDDEFRESADQQMAELKFLVHGCDVTSISTATYTTILPFGYFPPLHAIGLEFPLDDPRYNMIILIPTEGTDSQSLARVLSSKTLRYLKNSMRPTWVKATIPSFMLRGFITLTPYLQQLGIKDAFEPRAADLSPMSTDLGIYARDVHQSIGVNIRNYIKNGDRNNLTNGLTKDNFYSAGNILSTREPIPFTVDRPFLFFIVDAETSVSLIAGRIDDPLNSRII